MEVDGNFHVSKTQKPNSVEDWPNLTGPFGDRVNTGFLESGIVNQLARSLRETRDTWGVPTEEMTGIGFDFCRGWVLVQRRTPLQGHRKLACSQRTMQVL